LEVLYFLRVDLPNWEKILQSLSFLEFYLSRERNGKIIQLKEILSKAEVEVNGNKK